MRILAVDVGTGTQDILLFDSEQTVENSVKMIMPSPTVIVAGEIARATARGDDVLLSGFTMGGGPCAWAVEDHLRHGFRVRATPAAARTFNDDLTEVRRMGVTVLAGDDDGAPLRGTSNIVMGDLNRARIERTLRSFGVSPQLDAIAVAVFDHGNAPPGVSDRLFRFQYLARIVEEEGLYGFAHAGGNIPEHLTRMQAVAASSGGDVPLVVMDTGPAAILGALEDEQLSVAKSALVVNVGNFHTLAFHMVSGRVAGMFEHHTGMLNRDKLEAYLCRLTNGTLTNEEIFGDSGHGALILPGSRPAPELLAVTGPRRSLMYGSPLHPYFAVPHGDMMVAGCFGLLRAVAAKMPSFSEVISTQLGSSRYS